MMRIRVLNRETQSSQIYSEVESVQDYFTENGTYCHQLVMSTGETATFPATEWRIQEEIFVDMF